MYGTEHVYADFCEMAPITARHGRKHHISHHAVISLQNGITKLLYDTHIYDVYFRAKWNEFCMHIYK